MSRAVSESYEFGPFLLDPAGGVLTRDRQVVPLAPKTFDLLVLFLQHPGRAFSKLELMHALWPDTFVEEANRSFQVSVLRKALGADGARWVETVPKHGYRFDSGVRTTIPSSEASAAPPSAPGADRSSVTLQRSTGKPWLAGATVTVALLVLATLLWAGREPGTGPGRTSPALPVPLTAYPGDERAPSPSPDGSRVAFSWDGPARNNYDIYVKLAGPGEPIRLTTNPAPDESPAWSPDGRSVAFMRIASANAAADLVVIPAQGGAERTIATIFPMPIKPSTPTSNLSWTPDGRWLAFGGATSAGGPQGIWLMAVDGSEHRRLTGGPAGGPDQSPIVSPDGGYLAFVRPRTVGRSALFVVPLTSDATPSGTPRQLTPDNDSILGFAWAPQRREIVFSAGPHLGLSRLARTPVVPDGSQPPTPEFLTFGEQAAGLSIARTGSARVCGTIQRHSPVRACASKSIRPADRARRLQLDVRRTHASLLA